MKNRERETEATEQELAGRCVVVRFDVNGAVQKAKAGHECCRTLAASWAGSGTVVRGATDRDGGLA